MVPDYATRVTYIDGINASTGAIKYVDEGRPIYVYGIFITFLTAGNISVVTYDIDENPIIEGFIEANGTKKLDAKTIFDKGLGFRNFAAAAQANIKITVFWRPTG
jgi:hypothetical protein